MAKRLIPVFPHVAETKINPMDSDGCRDLREWCWKNLGKERVDWYMDLQRSGSAHPLDLHWRAYRHRIWTRNLEDHLLVILVWC